MRKFQCLFVLKRSYVLLCNLHDCTFKCWIRASAIIATASVLVEVAVAVIQMFKLRWGLNTASSKNGALKHKQKFAAKIIRFHPKKQHES